MALPVPRLAPAMKGWRHARLPLPTLGGLGPREARQDSAVPKCLVVTGSGGGLSHCLAEVTPKQALVVNGDVLGECGKALYMGACPDSQGLCSESAETGMYSPGPNVGHHNHGMFDAGVCEGRFLGVLPSFQKGLLVPA